MLTSSLLKSTIKQIMKGIIKCLFTIFLLLGIGNNVRGQNFEVPVFTSGTEGYKNFRIPAIIQLPNQEILAFCEGRLNGTGDFGNIDIVMKRSKDGGILGLHWIK